MTTHRISTDFYEHSYTLIAVHCSLADYQLAYQLNSKTYTKFKRIQDIDFYNNSISFSTYEWEDQKKDMLWNLVSNTSGIIASETNNNTLFDKETPILINYLIPERKKTDYFIKIDGELMQKDTTDILNEINKIPQIITAYTIEPNQLKSRNNLIL